MFVGMIEGEEKRPKKLQAYLKYDHGVNGHDAFHPMRCLGANTGFKAKLCKNWKNVFPTTTPTISTKRLSRCAAGKKTP